MKKDLKGEEKEYIINTLLGVSRYFLQYDSQIDEKFFREASKETTEQLGGKNIMDELDFTMEGVVQKKVEERLKERLQESLQEVMQKGMKQGLQRGLQRGIQKGIQKGIEKGIQKGREEGLQEGRREITLKLLHANMDLERVSKITGLSKQEIRKFQKNTKK